MSRPNPFANTGESDELEALHAISRMHVGTRVLKDEPGVLYALAQQGGSVADAQAIEEFLQGLDAERQVRLAEATGQQIELPLRVIY